MRTFRQLSAESANIYYRHIVARGPARLQELAIALKSSGGPIELMDGSLESLTPLWEWWMAFAQAGFPGIEPLHSSALRALASSREIAAVKAHPAPRTIEMLEHYVMEVLQRADPRIDWDYPVYEKDSRSVDLYLNCTGIRMPNGYFVWIANTLAIAAGEFLSNKTAEKQPPTSSPSYLYEMIAGLPIEAGMNKRWVPDGSILTPLSTVPKVVWRDPLDRVVLESASEEEIGWPAKQHAKVGEDTLFIARGADFDNLASAPPIDETAAARILNDLGFRALDGQPISSEVLQDGAHYFELPNQAASIESEAHGGRLRSFILTPIALTESEWNAMIAALTALGDEVGGELRGEGNF